MLYKSLGRIDPIHLLAWQKLKFYRQLRHSSNTLLFLTCFSIYNMTVSVISCSVYSCRQFDSLSRLRVPVEGHLDDICVAREF